MTEADRQTHWQNVYRQKGEQEVSWTQADPQPSLGLIERFANTPQAAIIDIGGGASRLVDALLVRGFDKVTVLDLSEAALEAAKLRIGPAAGKAQWIAADVTAWQPPRAFDIWHDRAAFHFLTTEEKIHKYVSIAECAIRTNGYLILGTFSEAGPDHCSGLAVRQYSQPSMSARFEKAFERIRCVTEDHKTPFNTVQNFLFCSFRRKKDPT